ncbi:MAG: hypothetical protein AAF519_09010 [Bacteroidota bacterium]
MGKGVALFIGSMLLLALLTHLFPPTEEGFANPAVVVVPFFISAISSLIYTVVSLIRKDRESKLFKFVVALNFFVNVFAVAFNV